MFLRFNIHIFFMLYKNKSFQNLRMNRYVDSKKDWRGFIYLGKGVGGRVDLQRDIKEAFKDDKGNKWQKKSGRTHCMSLSKWI